MYRVPAPRWGVTGEGEGHADADVFGRRWRSFGEYLQLDTNLI
jgi:hypothetical protein